MNLAGPPEWTITPEGDRSLIIEFGQAVDPQINAIVRSFAQQLLEKPIDGILDVVPAFTTVTLHYRPECFTDTGSPWEDLRQRLQALLAHGINPQNEDPRTIEIPICYGGEYGPDLEEVATTCGLPPAQVVTRHLASAHQVYLIGFTPGLPQIGGLDPSLAIPRRSTPRTHIPAGSVAIAGDQTCIYPLETPGGWNVIGRTPLRLFDTKREPPCLLQAGDRVHFVPISADEFGDMA